MSRKIEYHIVSCERGCWGWEGKAWDNPQDAYDFALTQKYDKFKIVKDTYTFTEKTVMKSW